MTGAKWKSWDLLIGNLTLLNVEFLKTKELTLTHTRYKHSMYVCTVCMLTYIAENVWAVLNKFSMSICIFVYFLCTFTHRSIPYI